MGPGGWRFESSHLDQESRAVAKRYRTRLGAEGSRVRSPPARLYVASTQCPWICSGDEEGETSRCSAAVAHSVRDRGVAGSNPVTETRSGTRVISSMVEPPADYRQTGVRIPYDLPRERCKWLHACLWSMRSGFESRLNGLEKYIPARFPGGNASLSRRNGRVRFSSQGPRDRLILGCSGIAREMQVRREPTPVRVVNAPVAYMVCAPD